MQFSIGVEYALHSLLQMVDLPPGKPIGVKELATFQGISETYLSKVFTKLRKAGIVRSLPGVNGGYELARSADKISFWDVVEAVEGATPIFQCAEIRQNNILVDKSDLPPTFSTCPCLIKTVMLDAETQMRNYLADKSLAWLSQEVRNKLSVEMNKDIDNWFKNALMK